MRQLSVCNFSLARNIHVEDMNVCNARFISFWTIRFALWHCVWQGEKYINSARIIVIITTALHAMRIMQNGAINNSKREQK